MEWVVEHWWLGLVIIGGAFVTGVIGSLMEGDKETRRFNAAMGTETFTQATGGLIRALSVLAMQWAGPAYLVTALVGWTVLELKS